MRKRHPGTCRIKYALFASLLLAGGTQAFAQETESETPQSISRAGQLSVSDIQALNDGAAVVHTHDGKVTLVEGTCTADPVRSMEDAAAVVASAADLLGGEDRAQFAAGRSFADAAGNRYYVFQQMAGDTTVCGGAVKVITNPEGEMTALSASVVSGLPAEADAAGISAEEAEALVAAHSEAEGLGTPRLVEDATQQIILPLTLSVDDEEENDSSRYVWVVYTNQTDAAAAEAELPYLAHYVTMDGTYLYSLPTIMPGDESGSTGFDASYVFEFMEPVPYTGYVDLADGTEQELTVTVMRDRRTGMYYLGDPERRIVVADCSEFLYNGGTVVLEASPDNREWDQTALLSLYNYCRVYDYYGEIGWEGGDGNGTPILVLNDYRDEDGDQVDNAAFVGNYLGWSIFLSSRANSYAQCLDVIAHEFTHCVTGSVMTYNSYMNDYGAINEGVSDIQGELCEQRMEGPSEEDWLMAEDSGEAMRSLSDPNVYQQPGYTWDLYYYPNVQTPTLMNDQGGVHTNSSLLNRVAYLLCTDGGMTQEEARAFWFAADCAMVPGTDYRQLAELLPWVLKTQGMQQYLPALEQALSETALGSETLPEQFDSSQALLTLTLPDDERFKDGNWVLQVFTLDASGIREKIHALTEQFQQADYSAFPAFLRDLMSEEPQTDTASLQELIETWKQETMEWLLSTFRGYFYSSMLAAGADGQTIRMVCRPGYAFPVLMHASLSESTMELEQVAVAFWFNGKWYALHLDEITKWQNRVESRGGEVTAEDAEQLPQVLDEGALEEIMEALIERFFQTDGRAERIAALLDLFFPEVGEGEMLELPADGLERVTIPDETLALPDLNAPEEEVPPTLSRPKETEENSERGA